MASMVLVNLVHGGFLHGVMQEDIMITMQEMKGMK